VTGSSGNGTPGGDDRRHAVAPTLFLPRSESGFVTPVPLFPGIPGGPELIVLFLLLFVLVIPFGFAFWVANDVGKRGSVHRFAWGAMAFVTALFGNLPGLVVFFVFYLVVRDDVGTRRP
jgi:hypothetical protein